MASQNALPILMCVESQNSCQTCNKPQQAGTKINIKSVKKPAAISLLFENATMKPPDKMATKRNRMARIRKLLDQKTAAKDACHTQFNQLYPTAATSALSPLNDFPGT